MTRTAALLWLSLGLLQGLLGCGSEPGRPAPRVEAIDNEPLPQENEAGAYSYTDTTSRPACSTGTHRYQNLREFCQKLKDNGLNRNCAQRQRELAFQSHCGTRGQRSEVSLVGAMSGDVQTSSSRVKDRLVTRWEGSLRVVTLSHVLPNSPSPVGQASGIKSIDFIAPRVRIVGFSEACPVKVAVSTYQQGQEMIRFSFSVEDQDAAPRFCADRLLRLRSGWSAKILGVSLTDTKGGVFPADVNLTAY